MFWSDNKDLLSRTDNISWNSLKKKKKKNEISQNFNHQLVCQSGKWLLCSHQVPRFDTPCPHYVGYTISMCGLKTNGACVGLRSLSSTFRLVVPLGLPNCTLGCGIMTAHMSPFFFFSKKKKKKVSPPYYLGSFNYVISIKRLYSLRISDISHLG